MQNEHIHTTLSLPTALVGKCKETYGTENASEAIFRAIEDFHILPPKEQKISRFALHNVIPDPDDRLRDVRSFTIRIEKGLFNIIQKFLDNDISETVSNMMGKVLYVKSQQTSAAAPDRLLYVLGNKSNKKMQQAIRNIKETAQNATWTTSVETCAGGLGIHAKFKFADNEILNDADWQKINLYHAIQSNPRELIIRAGSLKVNRKISDKQKKILQNAEQTSDINYEAAAAYLYLNLNSTRSKGNKMTGNASDARYRKYLRAIRPLHQRLTQRTTSGKSDTKLSNFDIFEIIGKYRKRKNVLFIIDPPYLNTDHYNSKKTNKFNVEKHKHLAKLQRQVKHNNGNDFISFCRITAAKRDQSKPNAAEYDNDMKGWIDDPYYGYGFFYVDVMLDANTTDRIITSFDFNGATPYGDERGRR